MIWSVIFLSGILTYATRFLPLSKIVPKKLPHFIQDGLQYVSIAVLTPIIINSIITSDNNLVNYWIQSSAVDFCSFTFLDFVQSNNLEPCFFIHDSLTFQIEKERLNELENISHLQDPISKIKIPVEFNLVS